MTLVYRGALIGCGFFARNHMEAWHREPRAKIIAVCDLDAGRARAMASSFGVERVYTDAAEMLRTGYELGSRLFDTAPLYGSGLAEQRTGMGRTAGFPALCCIDHVCSLHVPLGTEQRSNKTRPFCSSLRA